jgi:trimeric autotransporter adhesin
MWKKFNHWLLTWKPIHLCWWYMGRGKPIPKYFIGTSATAPSVTTNAASSIQAQQATGNGNVTSTGGSTTSWQQGFVWSVKATNSDPTRGGTGVSEIVTSTSGGTGAYSGTLSSLSASTVYTYKAFAVNNKGTGYGAATDFTTSAPSAPTVTTQAVSSITTTSATGNGNITATGGANATRRGFCYIQASSGTPTTADSVAYDDGSFGTGAFTKSITGLSASTAYRVRAYAVNSGGTGYGDTVDLTTADPPNEPPTVALNSPADEATVTDTTPTLEFTGTDPDGNRITYQIQISENTF